MFSKFINLHYYPDLWKIGIVTPIHKKGADPSEPKSCRPITLLCCLSKIFERIILSFLMPHYMSIISSNQHGFVASRSVTTNHLTFYDDVTRSLDKHKRAYALYIDFAKAFDTVPHDILIKKLVNYKF